MAASPSPPAPNALPFDVKKFFTHLLEGIREGNVTEMITRHDIMRMLIQVRRVFRSQPVFLKLNGPIVVCGDLHGQFNDLIRVFDSEGFPNVTNYLFLGDYVDRGRQQIELILFMFACKIRYPRNFFMLRGNHETQSINNAYGFHESVNDTYKNEALYDSFNRTFDLMPLSARISSRILCMHGGLSPAMLDAPDIDKLLNSIERPLTDAQIVPTANQLAVDLLWADPDVNVNLFGKNHRGIGSTFGQEVINRVRRRFGLDLIIRAHQVVQDGFEFFAGDMSSGLLTLFTAPHYCGMYDNAGAIVKVSADLGISTVIFRPQFQRPVDHANPTPPAGQQEGKQQKKKG